MFYFLVRVLQNKSTQTYFGLRRRVSVDISGGASI